MPKGKNVKDIIRVISSNGIVLLLGLVITLLLPIKLSIEEFGYWQSYYFYSAFVGLFMFGFSDGISLKYAGKNYENLDKRLFRTYFRIVLLFSSILFILCFLLIYLFMHNNDRIFIFSTISFNIILFNINGFFTHVNQVSSRFKYYSWGLVLERLLFVGSIIPMFFLPFESYKIYIIVNMISRLLVLFYNVFTSKDLVMGEALPIRDCIQDVLENFRVGIYLTISSIISMLFIGYSRVIIDKYLGISEFGLYSFANSLLSMTIQIVIAVSAVLYPMLRRIDKNKYETLNKFLNLSVLILGSIMLCSYFPLNYIINQYLPKYSPILKYLFCLFPMIIYQCKNNIIVSTFYKTLRLEKMLLITNIIGLSISFVITMLTFKLFDSVLSIVASSVLCYALWNYYTEWYLIKKFNWSHDIPFSEVIIVSGFILITQNYNLIRGLSIYIGLLLIIGLLGRKSLMEWFINFKNILRAEERGI